MPRILEGGIRADAFPSSLEALKTASLLPRVRAIGLFGLAEQCKKKSVRKMIKRLDPVVRARTRKYEKLIEIFYPWRKIMYLVPSGTKTVEFEMVDGAILNEVIESILGGRKENRGAFKTAESVLYAQNVANIRFAEEPEAEQPSEATTDA